MINNTFLFVLLVLFILSVLYFIFYRSNEFNKLSDSDVEQFYSNYGNYKKYCSSCSHRSRSKCSECRNCGYCITDNGRGYCVPGNYLGPHYNNNCKYWEYGDPLYYYSRNELIIPRGMDIYPNYQYDMRKGRWGMYGTFNPYKITMF